LNTIAFVHLQRALTALAIFFAASDAALGAFLSEAYVAVQANDLSGPVVGTGPTLVSLGDQGVGTEASGVARINFDPIPVHHDPISQGVYATASVGNPGVGGDTGALAVASARTIIHVHAMTTVVAPTIKFGVIDVRVHGSINVSGPGATGTLYAQARAFDPLSIAFPDFADILIDRTTSSRSLSHLLRLTVADALFGRMLDYGAEGLALDLQLNAEAHATGLNSSVTADFSNTMEIASFFFYDDQGNLVPGVTVIDEHGAIYPVNVPEPNDLTVAVVLLIALFVQCNSRRCRSAN
jgi:hypothetical protein